MTKLFGRPCEDDFYINALAQLEQSSNPAERAFALNLMHDGRVSEAREAAFKRTVAEAQEKNRRKGPARVLLLGAEKYLWERIRLGESPEFADARSNHANIANAEKALANAPKDDFRLVRLLNLNGLTTLYVWAAGQAKAGRVEWRRWEFFAEKPDDATTRAWLGQELEGKAAEEQLPFVRDLLGLLRAYRKAEGNYHPTWAAFWHEFKGHLDDGPDRWSRIVGVDHGARDGQWILLLVYPVDPRARYARPTQLDAGSYGRHYPSPSASAGGHAMDLHTSSHSDALLTELIHTQVDHSEAHFLEAGRPIEATRRKISPRTLLTERTRHHDRLKQRYDVCPP